MESGGTCDAICTSCGAKSPTVSTGSGRDGLLASGALSALNSTRYTNDWCQRNDLERGHQADQVRAGKSLNPAILLAASLIHGACFKANSTRAPAALPV